MSEPWPAAWMRIVAHAAPGEPSEADAEFSFGDDQPDGDGWTPLYHRPDPLEWLRAILDDHAHVQARLRVALRSIAANTCCDRCHEAALVAQKALDRDDTEATEPDYLAQCAETMDANARQKWFSDRTADARERFGCQWIRQSINPGPPRVLLIEAWKTQPANEGEPRWQMIPITRFRYPDAGRVVPPHGSGPDNI